MPVGFRLRTLGEVQPDRVAIVTRGSRRLLEALTLQGDAQLFEDRLQQPVDLIHGHHPLQTLCVGETTGVPDGQGMRQMIAAPQNRSQEQRTSSLHEAERRLRGSDVDDSEVLRDGRSFFL